MIDLYKKISVASVLACLSLLALPALASEKKEDKASTDKSSAKDETKNTKENVIAVVDGQKIVTSDLANIQKALPKQLLQAAKDKKKLFSALRNQLVDIKVLIAAAKKAELDKIPEVKAAIDQAVEQVIVQAFVGQEMKKVIDDKVIKEKYDQYVKEFPKGKEEVKVRHILVKDETIANKVIKELDGNGDFLKLARDYSIDKASAAEGGDLGYLSDADMVPPAFFKAAMALKAGEYTKKGIKTDFGWHILKVDDRRKSKPKTLEEKKEELFSKAYEESMTTLIKGLREKAKIEVFDEKGNPEKFEQVDIKDLISTDKKEGKEEPKTEEKK